MASFTAIEIKKEIETCMPDVKIRLVRDSLLIENPKDLTRVVLFLKETPAFLLDYLSSVTGVDYLTYLESVYHLYSMQKKHGPVTLRVRVAKNDPKVPSLAPVYRSAELQEREAYDTFGIIYEGHPDPRRLFMWEEFQGHPLRKDYPQEDPDVLEDQDIAWLEKRGVSVPEPLKAKAQELKAAGKRALCEKPVKPRIA